MMQQSLAQYLLDHLADHPDQYAISSLLLDIARIGKHISHETNRAGLGQLLGAAGEMNVQGESVQKLDVFANDLCKDILGAHASIALLASEEEESVVPVVEGKEDPQYIIAFDPLDGSSNIDVNVSVGSIFSVHKKRDDIALEDDAQFFQAGKDQVLAAYVLYGSSTVLVFSVGDGVIECTLDPALGEFIVSREDMRLPEKAKYYSVNESNLPCVQDVDASFITTLREESGMSARYIGSLVADIHRNLLKGGIFLYPRIDKKDTGVYKGKLRMNYELKPLGYILAQAGGLSVEEGKDILEIIPEALHERRGVCMGNEEVVREYIQLWKN